MKTYAQRLWIGQQLEARFNGWSVKVWSSKDLIEVKAPGYPSPGTRDSLQGVGDMDWVPLSGDDAAALLT